MKSNPDKIVGWLKARRILRKIALGVTITTALAFGTATACTIMAKKTESETLEKVAEVSTSFGCGTSAVALGTVGGICHFQRKLDKAFESCDSARPEEEFTY